MAETEDGKKDVKKLAKNTGFLYLLSLSSQIVNLALIPFETRVLGSEAYGVIALSVAMSSIITIVLDFGLILSATERVVKLAGNAASLARLLGNVACAKACLALAVGMVIVVLILSFLRFPNTALCFFCTTLPMRSMPFFRISSIGATRICGLSPCVR